LRLLWEASSVVIFMITEYLLKYAALNLRLIAMKLRLEQLATMLAVTMLLVNSTAISIRTVFSNGPAGCTIDVFTQREPYSGKGLDMPSDAFGPEEILILYALVSQMGWPLENYLVAFHVFLPSNASFSLTARTNSSGIASINFTINTPPVNFNESDIFGYWHVLADVMIDNSHLEDSLVFRVDWIVKVLSVRTIDGNLTYQTNFGKGGDLGLEITLRSIAMTMRNATIAIVVYDVLNVPVTYTEIVDFDVPPNERLVKFFCKLQIPSWAYTGNSTVYVSALRAPASEGGLPFCPPVSASFVIKSIGQLTLAFHDAAVLAVTPSATSVELGQPLGVNVTVRNEGTEVENFNVYTYFGDALLGVSDVVSLASYAELVFNFTVDTSSFSLGNYTVSAVIPPIANEADLADNTLTGDIVEIEPMQPIIVHDITIINVTVSSSIVYSGDEIEIDVYIVNKGTETESFNVSAFYDSKQINTLPVNGLLPQNVMMVPFLWNTSFVGAGFYQIGASAPLNGDVNPSDNVFVDGMIEVKSKPPPPLTHDVAVLSLTPSAGSVNAGTIVNIYVVVTNFGNYTESFDVTAYYDFQVVGTLLVENLFPDENRLLDFVWNTTGIPEGNYTFKAVASTVLGEQNTGNNRFVDGIVEITVSQMAPKIHDVAILSVVPSPTSVYVGDPVNIEVRVKNLGNYTEFFNVTVFFDSHIVGTVLVGSLLPSEDKLLIFGWDTQGVPVGTYTLKANLTDESDENTANNYFIDGTVEVKTGPPPPPPIHDVAVVSVIPEATFVTVGDTFNINVTVKNNGTETESFSVFLYYNGTENKVAPSISVTNLAAGTETTVIFSWNTSSFVPNNYTLVGYAQPVQDEVNTADNALTDGTVKLVPSTRGTFTFDLFWLWLLIILLLLLLIILIIFMLYRRRKKSKKNQGDQTFMSGWIAWYYRHDLQDKRHKT